MDLHAGWVKIDSDPGVGSQVSLNFPVVDTDVIIKNIADPTESFSGSARIQVILQAVS